MARRKAKKKTTSRKKRKPRARRPTGRRAAAKKAAPGASAALAKARARIAELEAENRRLQQELAALRDQPRGSDLDDDGPLAPGM